MPQFFDQLLNTDAMLHGSYLRSTQILWLEAVSDSLTSISMPRRRRVRTVPRYPEKALPRP
jgi:hypothetical protein